MQKRKSLKWLCIFIAIQLFIVALITYIFDPFYQYHAPLGNADAVLYDRDNQVVGTVRNFDYDAVLVGSSVAENFDSTFLDSNYDCKTLKVVRASGSVADLLYYLDMAHENASLKQVFWCLDIFALTAPTQVTLYGNDIPRYLHTKSLLDDIPYLFNKEILLTKIPLSLAYAHLDINTNGDAYDWSADKNFSVEGAMCAYDKPVLTDAPVAAEINTSEIDENISLLMAEINAHPEIQYTFFFPPYSMMWWDCGYVNGISDSYFYVLENVMPQLLTCENVSLYYFQSDTNIICNLDNYMDMIHYSPQINQYMLDSMVSGKYQVTTENLSQTLTDMKETFHYIIEEGIYLYYTKPST